jgi:hypothetical protein
MDQRTITKIQELLCAAVTRATLTISLFGVPARMSV